MYINIHLKGLMLLLFAAGVSFLYAGPQNDCHVHTVQPGEGIYSISRLYGLKPSQIMSFNSEIGKDMMIKTGQKICIPKGLATIPAEQIIEADKILAKEKSTPVQLKEGTVNPSKQGDNWIHTVQKGETFYSICKLYKLLAYDLISVNNLQNTIVYENQKLIIPATGALKESQAQVVSPIENMVKENTVAKSEPSAEVATTTVDQSKMPQSSNLPGSITVQKGDTYFSLTKKFNFAPNDLLEINKLTSRELKIGQKLLISQPTLVNELAVDEGKIPTNAVVIDIAKEVAKRKAEVASTPEVDNNAPAEVAKTVAEPPAKTTTAEQAALVAKDEPFKTEQSIENAAKLELPVANDLAKDVVPNIEQKAAINTAKPLLSFSEEYSNTFTQNAKSENVKIKKSRGVGEYTDGITGNEYLAYSSVIESGSIIKVTNLMNRASAFVKVIGPLFSNTPNDDALIKISKGLAQKLQVIDDKFLIEISSCQKN